MKGSLYFLCTHKSTKRMKKNFMDYIVRNSDSLIACNKRINAPFVVDECALMEHVHRFPIESNIKNSLIDSNRYGSRCFTVFISCGYDFFLRWEFIHTSDKYTYIQGKLKLLPNSKVHMVQIDGSTDALPYLTPK